MLFQKGHKINLGRKHSESKAQCMPKTEEHKKKISNARQLRKLTLGYINSTESRIKMSMAKQGVKHPFWNGGSSFEPYTSDWSKTLRRAIRERDHYSCGMCRKQQDDITFDVHHIDYNKKNCSPTNLILLCKKCHAKTNFNREYWVEYFKEKE